MSNRRAARRRAVDRRFGAHRHRAGHRHAIRKPLELLRDAADRDKTDATRCSCDESTESRSPSRYTSVSSAASSNVISPLCHVGLNRSCTAAPEPLDGDERRVDAAGLAGIHVAVEIDRDRVRLPGDAIRPA